MIFPKSSAHRSIWGQDRGRSALGCLVFIIILGAVGYVGFKFGEAGWEYMDVRQKVREALNWAIANNAKTDPEMFGKISQNVREAGLEVGPRSVRITHAGEKLTFTVTWTRDVVLPYYTVPLHFRVTLTEIKRWTSGPLIFKY